ncbi:pyridoxal phosphate-dependent decarboxylase family protein [Synechococcus sp. W4D4]|uniref:pyridoxal phosphate-dependent decarboxylase family protein n=1 Tax=Synechococcus sp. W4D4 TaxID=3392294 RepID=UPI0039EAD7D9
MAAERSGSLAHAHPSQPQRSLACFPDPLREDPALESFLREASARLCQWWAGSAQRSPLPLLSVLPEPGPLQQGLSPEALLEDLQLVMDGAYNPIHPGAMAHLDPPPLTASVAADLVCAGLNNNLLAEELSPSLSRLERSLTTWMAEQLGLGESAGGVAASGGSLSNLMALVVARHQAGLAEAQGLTVFCSADAHVSIAKAWMVMGLPKQSLQTIETDAEGRLSPDALAQALKDAERDGRRVLAVVATAGTTVRGAVDPLASISDLCRLHGVWLHVDGAIGAVFGLSQSHKQLVPDLDRADSLTVNPQKLLGITKTSSLLLLKRPELLASCFGTGLPYMEPSWADAHGGECGLQGTRPAEILKLWLGLRQLGLDGIESLLHGALQRRAELQQHLSALPLMLRSGPLHLLAFTPSALEAHEAERWSIQTRQQLLEQQLMLSRPLYAGRHHLKAVLGNPHTRSSDLAAVASVIQQSLAPA